MRDAITGLIGRYDQLGRYLDRNAMDSIDGYLSEAALRLQAVELINREAAEIVREASQRLFQGDPELLLPGGNAYTCLLYTSPSPRDATLSRMPSSA